MFDFKEFSGITFTILGAVIGAGFISGREIVTFFYGYDPLISSALFAAGFTVVLFILFFDRSYINSKWFSFSKPLVYIGDLILAAGMLSALDNVYYELFPALYGYPALSIVSLIVSNVIVSEGVNGLKSANFFLTPLMIITIIILLAFSKKSGYEFTGNVSYLFVAEYIGLNVFTSSVLFSELNKKTNAKTATAAAVTASIILAALIFFILSAIASTEHYSTDMPLLSLFSGNSIMKWIFSIVILFGIFTTLIASHYPLYSLVKTKKGNFFVQLLLSLTIFSISRLGFYNIVSNVYPIMGAVGIIYIVITSILQAIFRSRRPKNTSLPQECKV